MKQNVPDIDPSVFQDKAKQAAELLKAMANENRLMILCRLGIGELTVSELMTEIGLSQSALSQHLAGLRQRNFVATRRENQKVFYRISDPAILRVIDTLIDIYCPEMKK